MRQAPHTWDAVGRLKAGLDAVQHQLEQGTALTDVESQSCGESGSRLAVATRAKWWGSINFFIRTLYIKKGPLRYVLFPRVTEHLTGEPIAIKGQVGLACAGPEMAMRQYSIAQPWYLHIYFCVCVKPDIVRIDRLRALS